jgi:phosphate transport system permease protein
MAQVTRRAQGARRVTAFLRESEAGIWRNTARVAVVLPLAALVFAVTVLAIKARPAIIVNGWGFFTRSSWSAGQAYATTVSHIHGFEVPTGASYGAGPLLVGTIASSLIAVVIALPISIGAAFALTERMPRWLSQPLGFFIELLAGIPSVLFGLWGILVFGPILARDIYPAIANNAPNVPVLDFFRGRGPINGEGLLTGGIVLALMIVPIITATTRDLFTQVPPLPKEGGEALGMTDLEVARKVTIPWVRSGIIGATVLGLGRALGETIAIAMISGALLDRTPANIFGAFGTIAATIVTQLSSSATDATGFTTSTLAELGLILAVVSVGVNVLARVIIHRSSRIGAPLGTGQ